jgi:hypothetical protein
LLKLNTTFQLRRGGPLTPADLNPADFIDPAWREALKRAGTLWYLRRRNLPDGRGLAGTPLNANAEVIQPAPVRPETPATPVTPAPPSTPVIDRPPISPTTPVVVSPPVVTPTPTSPGVVRPPVTPVNPGTTVLPVSPVITSPVITRPTTPIAVTPVRPSGSPAQRETESRLSAQLAKEGLWGRFAFLRAISDATTHAALVDLLATPLVLDHPLLQQAVFTALEKALPTLSESPEENFEQIQKDADLKVLTPKIIAEVEKQLATPDVVRGLEIAAKKHPKLLSSARHRRTLGRTNRIGTLAEIGLRHAGHTDFAKLMTAVERSAGTGRAQTISDALDRFLKKVNA